MPERSEASKTSALISSLYVELATACLDKAAAAQDAGTVETLQRMGRCYLAQATIQNSVGGAASG